MKICARAGIKLSTVNALRHSFGAHLRMAGVNLAEIGDLLWPRESRHDTDLREGPAGTPPRGDFEAGALVGDPTPAPTKRCSSGSSWHRGPLTRRRNNHHRPFHNGRRTRPFIRRNHHGTLGSARAEGIAAGIRRAPQDEDSGEAAEIKELEGQLKHVDQAVKALG
jgi:hypothetical protein